MNRILASILASVWLIQKSEAVARLPFILPILKGVSQPVYNITELEEKNSIRIGDFAGNGIYVVSEYGRESAPENAKKNSVAVIGLTGVMTKYDQDCGGPAGSVTKNNLLARCMANPNIKGIILYTDGPGGEARAPERLYETIRNRNKPVITLVDGLNASAHYWATSPCDQIIATSEMDVIGSIGAYTTIIDIRKQLKKEGISLKEIYATQSSDKNKAYRDAMDGDEKMLQASIDFLAQKFINSVKSVRGDRIKDDSHVYAGMDYKASDALKIGLIDGISGFNGAINNMEQMIISSEKQSVVTHYF